MKTFKLISILIENVRGISSFEQTFDGKNASIHGATGKGKTSIQDSVIWLWTDKNSEGRSASGKSKFEIRPMYTKGPKIGQYIPDVITVTQAVYDIDGTRYTLRKEHKENKVKGKVKGYVTERWIDEVPYTATAFDKWVSDMIPLNVFKKLTDLRHFNETLKWQERRQELTAMAPDIEQPEGFDDLHTARESRTVDQFRTVLTTRTLKAEKDQKENSVRIDENQAKINQYTQAGDFKALEKERDETKALLVIIDEDRAKLLAGEKERQAKLDEINAVKRELSDREATLATDTSNIGHLFIAKNKLTLEIQQRKDARTFKQTEIDTNMTALATAKEKLKTVTEALSELAGQKREILANEDTTVCFHCGQGLPDDKLTAMADKKAARLEAIKTQGMAARADVTECTKGVHALETGIKRLQDDMAEAIKTSASMDEIAKAKIGDIVEKIDSDEKTKPEDDEQWVTIKHRIEALEAELGKSMSEQLTALDDARTEKTEAMDALNASLSKKDVISDLQQSIKDHRKANKGLAQVCADTKKMLDRIDEYKGRESTLVEDAVNSQFKLVKWKLFGTFLNGNADPCCFCTLDGKPYTECSTGERIMMNNDIANTWQAHEGYNIPRFIDDVVLVTNKIDTDCQTIRLVTDEKQNKLKVNLQKEA